MYQPSETHEEIIEKIIAHINKKLPAKQAKLVTEFTRQYYTSVALSDLLTRSPDDWYGVVLSHWNFALQRMPIECKVRVYNPNYAEHHWQSTHTIIEISDKDKPFLVDSSRMVVSQAGIGMHLMIHLGGMPVSRDTSGHITKILPKDAKPSSDTVSEALIHIEIDKQTDPAVLERLRVNIEHALGDVRVAVEDWQAMRARVEETIVALEKSPPPFDPANIEESKHFLSWLLDDHFTFLGARDYVVTKNTLDVVPGTGLGILRDERSAKLSRPLSELPPAAMKLALEPEVLIISKTNASSMVHRLTHADYIGVKQFNKKGELIGERRFIGLYTSIAYNSNPTQIPFLRQKVETIMKRSGLALQGHSAKALVNILETLPRDDLFQGNVDELYEIAIGILALQERAVIRLFVRKDVYGRFVSCLVYLPRERVNEDLSETMSKILMQAFGGTHIKFTTHFTESVLARIHFTIRINPNIAVTYDLHELEAKLIAAARSWNDELRDHLIEYYGEEKGNELNSKYAKAFPPGYRDDFDPRTAVYDIEYLEKLSDQNPLEMNLYRSLDDADGSVRLRLYQPDHAIPLSDVLPMLENMGLRVLGERPHELILQNDARLWINDFGMAHAQGDALDIAALKGIFQEAFLRVWYGHAENDGFNRLILAAHLDWKEVAVLRAYTKYLKQIGFTFSQSYIEETLSKNAEIGAYLVELFKLRFDPKTSAKNTDKILDLETKLNLALNAVVNLDEDRILRRFLELIKATIRTNYFQPDKLYLSFKFDSSKIMDMPLPCPLFEIFVCSPRFEGIHLRSGKVARGGLRWSDRREDFRTEVLGLMKAQQVKNSVIVPAGAKGGFVPKCLPTTGDREAIMEEVVFCYKNFIRGLLDLTDNLKGGEVIPPENTVRYDENDPYLVVAADKGTATFSDIANSISAEYGFWLGDAFASGGSMGYDHKKMGITARGAWESVKRHCRELALDLNTTDFTVVGIGDMSGDVFGNGMLLSQHICLVGAFNHQHIFLDPSPNAAKSFVERERLFNLPRSSWADYDAGLISKGGGVYLRSAKSIPVSPEVKQLLDLDVDNIMPNDLIRALLKARVDLLWNGGIGTYVKARTERDIEVGDRSNDAIRINGDELRCRAVGEGGNLGFTQLGRVEYSLNEGLIYTDFIDNSAGVDCSDHEVNIKILLNGIVASGDMTLKQRNTLLLEMTDEIGQLVLQDNYYQTQAISHAAAQAVPNLDLFSRYMDGQEKLGLLPRALEFLPDSKTLTERKMMGKGLTRPELAVLLSYCKINLKNEILASDIPEDPYVTTVVEYAFPTTLRKKFRTQMAEHSLRREIIATQLSNSMINHMGITFVHRLQDETGAPISSIVRAYIVAKEVFDMEPLMTLVEGLDYKVPSDTQIKMTTRIVRLIRRSTRWFLRNRRAHLDIPSTIEHFRGGVAQLYDRLPVLLTGSPSEKFESLAQELVQVGVPSGIAHKIAITREMFSVLDIIESATENHLDLDRVASVYFALDERLELGWLRDQFSSHEVSDHWDALARAGLRDDLDWQQRGLTVGVLQTKTGHKTIEAHIDAWIKQHQPLVTRCESMLANLRSCPTLNFLMFSVAVRELMDLTAASLQAAAQNGKQMA